MRSKIRYNEKSEIFWNAAPDRGRAVPVHPRHMTASRSSPAFNSRGTGTWACFPFRELRPETWNMKHHRTSFPNTLECESYAGAIIGTSIPSDYGTSWYNSYVLHLKETRRSCITPMFCSLWKYYTERVLHLKETRRSCITSMFYSLWIYRVLRSRKK